MHVNSSLCCFLEATQILLRYLTKLRKPAGAEAQLDTLQRPGPREMVKLMHLQILPLLQAANFKEEQIPFLLQCEMTTFQIVLLLMV